VLVNRFWPTYKAIILSFANSELFAGMMLPRELINFILQKCVLVTANSNSLFYQSSTSETDSPRKMFEIIFPESRPEPEKENFFNCRLM